ncbi:MAG: acetyl-CoA acetyltransferase [Gammaproteobacteria bacterium]|nr:acetyl-CoA acetyltransferase [Gammaproteobacteria bacterium]
MSHSLQTPILVGVGQILNRIQDLQEALEPLEMMWQATCIAEADAACGSFLKDVQSIRVVRGMWRYQNPAKVLGERLGATNFETVGTLIGGNQNQAVINTTACEIRDGKVELVLITGAENGNSSTKARRQGVDLPQTPAPGTYDRIIGAEQQPEHHDYEIAKGIQRAVQVYPMYDNRIRYSRGESIDEHLTRVSGLWSRFNDVGLRNPNAWVQTDMSPEEIRTPSANNRPVSFPYTKFMNANMSVNMGAALIMTSVAKAKQLGIPESKWVYPLAGVKGYDHFSATVRPEFDASPGIRRVAERLLEHSNVTADELDYVDLYSCFPSAVQVAAKEYGLSEERDLTVTGGLTFGGGPLNNYVMHSIARTVELLRENPGSKGLVTANGGNIYKQVHGTYGAEPPHKPFVADDVQAQIDALPERPCLASHDGAATIESYTVMFDGFDPTIGHVACRTTGDERTWVNTTDVEIVTAMTKEEFCGREIYIKNGTELALLN